MFFGHGSHDLFACGIAEPDQCFGSGRIIALRHLLRFFDLPRADNTLSD